MVISELKVIDADTLLSTPMKKTRFIIDGLLPEGVSILCGAPKIGKSWLMLWTCLQVAEGSRSGEWKLKNVMSCICAWKIPSIGFRTGCIA